MPVHYLFGQTEHYQVETEFFTGPLDLLLVLIERDELDITKLSLSRVTNQYLTYLNSLTNYSAEEISAFLVVAAKLIQIKSEALLPRTTSRNQYEDDTADALIQQLVRYRQFKRLAQTLADRQQLNLRTYLRVAISNSLDAPLDLNLTVYDLVLAAEEVYRRNSSLVAVPENPISPPKITIRQKIRLITRYFKDYERLSFRQILGTTFSRLDVAISFLAVLELVKQHLIEVFQPDIFGEIEITPSGSWKDDVDFELEFDD